MVASTLGAMTDRKVILAVICFLGFFALSSLLALGVLIALLNKRGEITATHIAVFGLIGQPMSGAVGLLGGILASTRSGPADTPAPAGMVQAGTLVAPFTPDPSELAAGTGGASQPAAVTPLFAPDPRIAPESDVDALVAAGWTPPPVPPQFTPTGAPAS